MSEKALKIEHLHFSYRHQWTGKKVSSLKDINLEVAPGESFGFLGHNGAGKTTTIKCILDFLRSWEGSIRIFGEDSRKPKARKRIGYLPEHPYFYDHLTVQEAMEMFATLSGLKGAKAEASIARCLERLELSERKKSPLRSLSKGLMQRVGMAQALLHEPELLILDEPFSGLDPLGRRLFRDLFFDLKKEGCALFLSTHILRDVEFLGDRVSVMSKGEIKEVLALNDVESIGEESFELTVYANDEELSVAEGLYDEMERHDKLALLRCASEERLRALLEKIVSNKISIERLQRQRGSLEDLFVKIISEEGKQ